MRRLGFCAVAVGVALLAAPGTATADVVFDQADADELASTLADAYKAQGVCYGWSVDVSDATGASGTSVGSNFGAGRSASDGGDCSATVEFLASITWTSESSESEDSVSYQVNSRPSGPTTEDLDSLEIISDDGLLGDSSDVDIYKAVSALPLLAADAGIADPIEATPAPESVAASASGEPTNSPGSDFWRDSGMQVLWGALLILGAAAFGFYAYRSSKQQRSRPVGPPAEQIPPYVPPEWSGSSAPPTGPPVSLQPPPGVDRPAGPRHGRPRRRPSPPAREAESPADGAESPAGEAESPAEPTDKPAEPTERPGPEDRPER